MDIQQVPFELGINWGSAIYRFSKGCHHQEPWWLARLKTQRAKKLTLTSDRIEKLNRLGSFVFQYRKVNKFTYTSQI